jgi:hypothetical protein
MKITAITNSDKINQQLASYALLLFELSKVELVDITTETIESVTDKIKLSSLVIIIADDSEFWKNEENLKTLMEKPVLLLSTYVDEQDNSQVISTLTNQLNQQKCSIWGTFSLLKAENTFNSASEINDIDLRLNLIRIINNIKDYKLGIKDKNRFTCGISRPKNYVGDSIGY